MSIVKKVSIYNAIFEAVTNGDELYINSKPLLLKWAKQSYFRIIGYSSLPEVFLHLTAVENRATLTEATMFVQAVFRGNVDLKPGYWNNPSLNGAMGLLTRDFENQLYILGGTIPIRPSGLTWSVQNNDLVFETNIDGQEITVDTYALEVEDEEDPNSPPLIEENLVEPIGRFLQYKLADKECNMKFRKGELRPNDMMYVKSLYNDYQKLVAKSRISATPSEHHEIQKMFNFPFSGSSLI
jgi:hypothetical protein